MNTKHVWLLGLSLGRATMSFEQNADDVIEVAKDYANRARATGEKFQKQLRSLKLKNSILNAIIFVFSLLSIVASSTYLQDLQRNPVIWIEVWQSLFRYIGASNELGLLFAYASLPLMISIPAISQFIKSYFIVDQGERLVNKISYLNSFQVAFQNYVEVVGESKRVSSHVAELLQRDVGQFQEFAR